MLGSLMKPKTKVAKTEDTKPTPAPEFDVHFPLEDRRPPVSVPTIAENQDPEEESEPIAALSLYLREDPEPYPAGLEEIDLKLHDPEEVAKPEVEETYTSGDLPNASPRRGAEETRAGTPGPSKAAQALVEQFRRAKTSAERRDLVPKILALGRPGALQFYRHLRYHTSRRLRTYAKNLWRFSFWYSRKSRRVDAEIKKLRAQARKLRSCSDLTTARIQKEGAPAVARLKELLIPTMDRLRTMPAPLKKQRERLLELYGYRTQCETALELKAVNRVARLAAIERRVIMAPLKQHKGLAAVEKANAKVGRKLDPLEVKGVNDLNLMRFVLGLRLLRIDVNLCKAARDHSKDMSTRKFFSHTSPVSGRRTPWDRAKRAGTHASAENIFAGSADPVGVNQAWFHSPGHHRNMLNPSFTHIGLGRHGLLWTMMLR